MNEQVETTSPAPAPRRRSLLGPMRIRKKLILLHTVFSLALATILMLAIRPAIHEVVARAEEDKCRLALDLLRASPERLSHQSPDGLEFAVGGPEVIALDTEVATAAMAAPGSVVMTTTASGWPRAVTWDARQKEFLAAAIRSDAFRSGVLRLYFFTVAALIIVYGLIALTLEVFVLPRQVYEPIRALLRADDAVQRGRRADEVIPDSRIPKDELGEIMRSRNESIMKLRQQEEALAEALERLELVANDLKRKNHLLETVQRNMADQDRLVSLGMMSAGLAHEMNTPLAVLKGSVERIVERPSERVDDQQAQLMLRVVQRLERLGESLLDFARVRPPSQETVRMYDVICEAWTLVRIDREARDVHIDIQVPSSSEIVGDPDRLTQVWVNLLRNAADAMNGQGAISISAELQTRDDREWLSVTCEDDGPGIDPDVLPRLFEPFTSTRLDARGAGLGLAVAEGIVREHGGVLLARNGHERGAIFEVVLPVRQFVGAAPSEGEEVSL